MAGLERAAGRACSLSCDGQWAIHPAQIDTFSKVITPSREDIERARRIIDADDAARAGGREVAAVDARMVNQAKVRLARRLKAQARPLGLL